MKKITELKLTTPKELQMESQAFFNAYLCPELKSLMLDVDLESFTKIHGQSCWMVGLFPPQ